MVMINLQLTEIELDTLRRSIEKDRSLSSKEESILQDILLKIKTMKYEVVTDQRIREFKKMWNEAMNNSAKHFVVIDKA